MKYILTILVALSSLSLHAQNYAPIQINPWYSRFKAVQLLNYPEVASPDSILVISSNRWIGRYSLGNFVKLNNVYNNPSFIGSLDYSKVSGAPVLSQVALDGQYSSLLGIPSTFAPSAHTHTPAQVGLGNVNNTADIDKPISAATQLALDAIPAYAKSLTAFSVIKSSSDLLYKGIAYTPTSAEVIASLGYTPYNGSTNPNGYVTQSGARTAISLTTTGTGSATYNNSTGMLNIPTYSAPVSTVFGRSGSVVSANGDYNTSQVTESGNLYFTNSRVLSTALTGVVFTEATAVLSTDNVLSSIGKLQAQSTARTPAVSPATVGLTRAQLNTAYPNTPVGYMVLAPSITLGGAIYVRATTGSSGVWQIISAPPVL